METLSSIIKNQGENPSMKPKLTRWGGGGGGGGFSNEKFSNQGINKKNPSERCY